MQREQLVQKLEKRRRARRYRVVTRYSGSWVPVSHGWLVLCHPPCTDEPRIKLNVGNDVVVTRWRKFVQILSQYMLDAVSKTSVLLTPNSSYLYRHWLFGERENESVDDSSVKRNRGWFPRNCVIEVIANGNDFLSSNKFD